MPIRIILVLKNDTEYDQFQGLNNYPECFEVFDIEGDFETWKTNTIKDNETEVYLLAHFGNLDSEDKLCKKIVSWVENINRQNVYIIPISPRAASSIANELYEKVKKDESLNEKELKSIKKYWDDECEKYKKKTLIALVLPFFLYCEIVYKFNAFEDKKVEIQKELKTIKNANYKDRFEFPEDIKQKWNEMEGLLDSNDKLKKDEMKKFIGLNEDGSKVPMEKTEWLTLLGNLKQWTVKADDQK